MLQKHQSSTESILQRQEATEAALSQLATQQHTLVKQQAAKAMVTEPKEKFGQDRAQRDASRKRWYKKWGMPINIASGIYVLWVLL